MSRKPLMVTVLSLGIIGCNATADEPMRLFLPGMSHSIPYNAYDPNPVTGQTLLDPPRGTVAYHRSVDEFSAGATEAERAGRELVNPLSGSADDLKRGKRVFKIHCAVCHGEGGEGDGPIIGRFPNPPSLLASHARNLPDGHIYHVITHGQGLMASYAVQVLPQDRWRLVLTIRSLQGAATAQRPDQDGKSHVDGLNDIDAGAPPVPTVDSPASDIKEEGP